MMKAFVTIGLLFALAGSLLGGCGSPGPRLTASRGPTDEKIILGCRSKIVSVDQVDAELRDYHEWKTLKPKIRPGDRLWKFRTPGPTWEKRMGWEGYALFRNDKLVGSVTTKEN